MRPVGGSFGCPMPAMLGGDLGVEWRAEGTGGLKSDPGCPRHKQPLSSGFRHLSSALVSYL